MSNNPLVTIIITCYNKENYIDHTIRSAINQSYKHLEIIVVNDGSTDKSLEIINKYSKIDNRIIVIDQENSGSPGLARNVGIQIAKGEFINFLDGDDLLYPKFIKKTLFFLNENPKVDIVHTAWDLFDNKYKKIALKHAPTSDDYLRDLLLGNLFATHALLLRKNLISKVGLMLNIQTEDWEYWTRCAKKGAKFERLDKVLVGTVSVPNSDHKIVADPEKRFFEAINHIYDGTLKLKYRKLKVVTLIKSHLYILEDYLSRNLQTNINKKMNSTIEFIQKNNISLDEIKYIKGNLYRLPLLYGIKLSKIIAFNINIENELKKYYNMIILFISIFLHKIKSKIKMVFQNEFLKV